jgi:hypothetical protein
MAKNPAAVALGRLGGIERAAKMPPEDRASIASAGGAARAEKLSAKRRREIARKAAQARWGKSK